MRTIKNTLSAAIILGCGFWIWLNWPHKPTPDELFGCDWAHTTPNGECP